MLTYQLLDKQINRNNKQSFMKLEEFIFDLPEELIAKYPAQNRSESRLLHPDTKNKKYNHLIFKDILDLFNPGDLLILNNTKVIPARFYGHKPTGAKVEFLLERVIDQQTALVYIKSNKSLKSGQIVNLSDNYNITVLEKQDNLFIIKLNQDSITWEELLDNLGEIPLPPYINRLVDNKDLDRYQTVYAEHKGAVAAPTAGLHFDQDLLEQLKSKGVIIKYITLHVGSGTFAPVRCDNIKEHKMHSERYNISQDVLESIIKLKNNNQLNKVNNKIIAVGTTSLRCLESIADDLLNSEDTQTRSGSTEIFIYPGYKFKLVDNLITNFHLPGSTLIMLVSAFAGTQEIKDIYKTAIENQYKFYSYGDAMFLTRA